MEWSLFMNGQPESYLATNEQQKDSHPRGRLKIFLGYAAGVGKTYAMLEAAQQRRAEGVDVVIGYMEARGRVEITTMSQGLERIPHRELSYQDRILTEMNIDAIVTRRPQLVLVDELAHNNALGSRHARRYQDVVEMLDTGIDVYTTLNIQHLESLNDVVFQITKVRVQETIPDHILDDAHEIELIDLPISELLARIQTGKAQIQGLAEPAQRQFFRPGNLTALREIALRRVADRVDEQMRSYMQNHAIPGPWPAGERLLVCVSPSPLSERLVRTARRLARRLDAEWIAAYVETPGHSYLPEVARDQVARTLRLAEELGARTVHLNGSDVAETLANYALSRNVTKMVVGKPLRPRWRELLHGSVVDRIVRHSQDLDVYVISGQAETIRQVMPRAAAPQAIQWRSYLLSIALVALATFVGLPLRPFINPTNLVMPYLAAVMLVAVWSGRYPAIIASLLSVIAFDVVFVPHYYTLAVADAEYLLTFAGLLAVGIVISTLAARAREQELAARRRERQTAALYELSQKLAAASELNQIAQTVVDHVQTTLGNAAALFLPNNKGEGLIMQASTPGYQLDAADDAVAHWVFHHGQPAGCSTETLADVNGYYLPLQTTGHVIGVLCLEFIAETNPQLTAEQRRFLASFATQATLALEKVHLAEQARQSRLLEETEKLQSALLNSISHDLRTPLASITGALSSLVEDAPLLSEEAQHDMVQMAWDESLRLNRLVGNLLDMTRLESGAMKVVCQPHDVQDLVGATLAQMVNRLRGRQVRSIIPDDLPPVAIDFALIVQALVNLVDNAVKYAPSDKPIEIEAYQQQGEVVIAVRDKGPGLPEAELAHIFNKFFRLNNAGIGGTGLGLSISKGIVEAHRGRVWAQNRPDGGASFFIALPIAATSIP